MNNINNYLSEDDIISEYKLNPEENPSFLNTIINASPNLVYVRDDNGRFVFANKSFADFCGKSVEGLIGQKTKDILNGEWIMDQSLASDAEVLESDSTINLPEEIIVNEKTGEVRWFNTVKSPVQFNKDERLVLTISSEITERVNAENFLKFQLQFEELLSNLSKDFISISMDDMDEAIERGLESIATYLNMDLAAVAHPGYERKFQYRNENSITQWNPEELLSHPLATKYQGPAKGDEMIYVTAKQPDFPELKAYLENFGIQSLIWFPVDGHFLHGGYFTLASTREGHAWTRESLPLFKIAGQIFANAIERKSSFLELESQAAELRRSNADLEMFAYAASHDMQEPLRMVSSYVHLIKRHLGADAGPELTEFMQYATDGVKRIQELINDLLEYSRVDRRGNAFVEIDMAQALDMVEKNLENSIHEKKAVIESANLPTVVADQSQMISLLQNLIENALKFSGDKRPLIKVSAEEKGEEWLFSVSDNGIGIDKKYYERIFVIFQRLNSRRIYPGTGIGLALCKKIVERHGGAIRLKSEMGIGTTFCFTLKKYI